MSFPIHVLDKYFRKHDLVVAGVMKIESNIDPNADAYTQYIVITYIPKGRGAISLILREDTVLEVEGAVVFDDYQTLLSFFIEGLLDIIEGCTDSALEKSLKKLYPFHKIEPEIINTNRKIEVD
jgi:hypothetical protein